MNAAYARPNYNPYSKTYNPGWRNHPNFSWSQSGHEQPRQPFPHQYSAQSHQRSFHQGQLNLQTNYQHNFQPTYQQQQQNHPDKKLSDLERMIETLSKTQASMMNMLAQRPITLVLMMINSCSYSLLIILWYSFRYLIKILVGESASTKVFWSFHMVIQELERQVHIYHSVGVKLVGSRLDRVNLETALYKKTSVCFSLRFYVNHCKD